VNEQTRLLLRYIDREMSAAEAERFRVRLLRSPELSRELRQMQQLGVLLRHWSSTAEARADDLLQPTLERIHRRERRRPRASWLAYGLLALPLLLLHASASDQAPAPVPTLAHVSVGAAIERIESSTRQARVFVVGSSETPVVWLSDDDREDEGYSDRDPG
jgi:hypothetical protein